MCVRTMTSQVFYFSKDTIRYISIACTYNLTHFSVSDEVASREAKLTDLLAQKAANAKYVSGMRCPFPAYLCNYNIETETKWPPFSRRHFKMHFPEWNILISINIPLTRVPKGQIDNIPALVQIMVSRRSGDKPFFRPMLVSLLTQICVTWLQWVKWNAHWIVFTGNINFEILCRFIWCQLDLINDLWNIMKSYKPVKISCWLSNSNKT